MYIFNEFDVEKVVWIHKGPSKRKLLRSLQKGTSVAFKLADGRTLIGHIRAIENPGNKMLHYGGDFEDDDNKYGLEISYNPRSGGYVLIKHVTPKDAPVRVHFKKSC